MTRSVRARPFHREFERIGNNRSIPVDVRLLAATNRDLASALAQGRFREDLFYRLNVFPIVVPALRDRADDIRLLVEYLVRRFAQAAGKKIRRIDAHALELLSAYDWTGNDRELQNVIERSVILCDGETLSVDGAWLRRNAEAKPGGNGERERIERRSRRRRVGSPAQTEPR